MASINKAIIVGNLGRDPEIRYLPDGTAVANFSVATKDAWTDKQTGERREKTEWHRIVAFKRLAEICGQYLHKGKQVYIEGRLQTKEWEGQDGVKRSTTEIIADTMQMLGTKGDSGPQAGSPDAGYGGYAGGAPSQGGFAGTQPGYSPAQAGAGRTARPQAAPSYGPGPGGGAPPSYGPGPGGGMPPAKGPAAGQPQPPVDGMPNSGNLGMEGMPDQREVDDEDIPF